MKMLSYVEAGNIVTKEMEALVRHAYIEHKYTCESVPRLTLGMGMNARWYNNIIDWLILNYPNEYQMETSDEECTN